MKKRLLNLLSAVAVITTLLIAGAFSADALLVGDVADNDGKLTSSDARLVLRAAVGLETLSDELIDIGDTDGDGVLKSSDARSVLRMSVGLDETKHYYKKEVTLAPDCTNKGTMKLTCTECDDIQEKEIDALGHDFASPEVLTAVTCETDGLEKYTCQRAECGHTEERVVAAGHTPDIPAATCTQAQTCTRGNHVMAAALNHNGVTWGNCSICKAFVTTKYAAEAETIKTKFNEAKAAFDAAYAVNNYNAHLGSISYNALPRTKQALPNFTKAKAAYEAALAECGNIPEFATIKTLLAKNIQNLTVSIEESNKIITFCDGNPGKIDSRNYDEMFCKLETYNAGWWNSDYSDYTIAINKKLVKEIKW